MELFRPDIEGDLLYFDLDTIICGDLSDIARVRSLTVLSNFYDMKGIGSGMMFLPESCREPIWNEWIKSPRAHMDEYRNGGDQAFLSQFWKDSADRWQDVLPGQVVSYKVHCKPHVHETAHVPDNARVICFHGYPKPRDLKDEDAAAILVHQGGLALGQDQASA